MTYRHRKPNQEKIINESTKDDYDFNFKLLMVGDPGVGKASILKRFTEGSFEDQTFSLSSTVESASQIIKLNDKQVKLHIYDLPGEGDGRNRIVKEHRYMGADVVIMVFNVDNKESYTNLVKNWERKMEQYGREGSLAVLVANKIDLHEDEHLVDLDAAIKLANTKGINYFETSAKENINIEAVFNIIASTLVIKDKLEKYIERIERHEIKGEIDFEYGFKFFKSLQASSRKNDYQIAKLLVEKLSQKPIQIVASELVESKSKIKSDELTEIVNEIKSFIQKQDISPSKSL